jgi:hypothetical protein
MSNHKGLACMVERLASNTSQQAQHLLLFVLLLVVWLVARVRQRREQCEGRRERVHRTSSKLSKMENCLLRVVEKSLRSAP